jgi:hypothetical protein
VDFKNQNPFSAGRMVDVNIQIYLANAASLTRNRGGYAVADLILRRNQVDPEIYDGGHYQVVLEVGYQQPNTSQGLISPAIKEGIDRSVVSMTLQMVDYDLSFEQNGVINLSIDYKARVEAILEDKEKYDIFNGGLKDGPGSTENLTTKIKQLQEYGRIIDEQAQEYERRLGNVYKQSTLKFDPENPDNLDVGSSSLNSGFGFDLISFQFVEENDHHITLNEKVRLQLQEAQNNVRRTAREASKNIRQIDCIISTQIRK